QEFFQGTWCVEVRNLTRPIQIVADVVIPNDFAIGGVEKRNPEAAEVKGALDHAPRIALRLREDVLRTERELLCLNNSQNPTADGERIIGRPALGRKLLDRALMI